MSVTTTITAAGLAMLRAAPGNTLVYTRAACGSGSVPAADLPGLDDVSGYVMELSITEITPTETAATLRLQLDNRNAPKAFSLSQIGVYAALYGPDGGVVLPGTLFMVQQLDEPDVIRAVPHVWEYVVNTLIGQAETVRGNIDMAAYVSIRQHYTAMEGLQEAITGLQDDVVGKIPPPAESLPKQDGAPAAGQATEYARADHIHPTDTGRANIVVTYDEPAPSKDNTFYYEVTELTDILGEVGDDRQENARKIAELEKGLGGWRVYGSVADLGITPGTETMEQVCAALPNYSIIHYSISASTANDSHPATFGMVSIVKYSGTRCKLDFAAYSSRNGGQSLRWHGWYANNVTPAFQGWQQSGTQSGTFTPELVDENGNTGLEYGYRYGAWYRTGNMIHLEVRFDITGAGDAEGVLRLQIPSAIAKVGSGRSPTPVHGLRFLAPVNTWHLMLFTAKPTLFNFVWTGSSASGNVWQYLSTSHFRPNANPQIYLSIDYPGE